MQQEYGYPETTTFYFTSIWYAVTDVGCLGSGALALFLASRGWRIVSSRLLAFAVCALLCSLLLLIPLLSAGAMLLTVLLAAGAGALGLFPIYHAFTQDITSRHQGKVTGLAGVVGWTLSSPTALLFGELADRTGTFRTGLMFAGAIPLIALVVLVMLWPDKRS
jgi:ACS family hexuronate transporter-like MFS transporter